MILSRSCEELERANAVIVLMYLLYVGYVICRLQSILCVYVQQANRLELNERSIK